MLKVIWGPDVKQRGESKVECFGIDERETEAENRIGTMAKEREHFEGQDLYTTSLI